MDSTDDFLVNFPDEEGDEPVVERVRNPLKDDPLLRAEKPRWWRDKSRKASKGQRKTIRELESEGYVFRRPKYGAMIDWNELFKTEPNEELDIWWEIGFGYGDNLLRLSEQYASNSKMKFFGNEIHEPGLGTTSKRLQQGLNNQRHWRDYTLLPEVSDVEMVDCKPYRNLRLCGGDAIKMLGNIPAKSLANVLITNPDPFPHAQRFRIIQLHSLKMFWDVIRPGGRLFLATDDKGFFEWSLATVEGYNKTHPAFRLIDPCPSRCEWLPVISVYEQRGIESNRLEQTACWEVLNGQE